MIELVGLSLPALSKVVMEGGFPKFRAKQIMEYIYQRHIFSMDEMLQLPQGMRTWLQAHCTITVPTIVKESTSSDGNTKKLLLRFSDGNQVETVLMRQHYGNSVCLSSQVGCAMGCIFCASTTEGLFRNLTVAEIVGQLLLFESIIQEEVHSIVVMGSGEPLQNFENTLEALRFIHEKESFNIGYRRMTVSTCGLVPKIYEFADQGLPITLALSLHATTDTTRKAIMPIGATYALQDVLDAVSEYYKKTERRVTFEYILIKDVNASEKEAHELGLIAKKFPHCNVNLIPVNGNEHINLYKPSMKAMQDFKRIVESYGVSVTIRKEMGDEIQAACGQLKIQHQQSLKEGM